MPQDADADGGDGGKLVDEFNGYTVIGYTMGSWNNLDRT